MLSVMIKIKMGGLIMRKKVVVSVLVCMLLVSMSACGKNEANVVTTTDAPQEEEAMVTEEPEEAEATAEIEGSKSEEVTEEVTDSGETTETEGKTKPKDKKQENTLEGAFCGFADGNSVEVIVDGETKVFQVGTNEAIQAFEKLEEGSVIIFETEEVDGVETISFVFE